MDFLTHTFSRENAKNHAFFGGQKMKTAAIYHVHFNHGQVYGFLAGLKRFFH
jgi:hypothetical protein